LIATRVAYDPPEEALLAGLLHDIGQLAMATFQPEAFKAALAAGGDVGGLLEREEAYLGIHHAGAGEQILKKWQLPEALRRVARNHHDAKIHQGGAHARLLTIVMLADKLTYFLGTSLEEDSVHLDLTLALIKKLGLNDTDVCALLEQLERRIAEAAEMLGIGDLRAEPDEQPHPRDMLWVTLDGALPGALRRWLVKQSGYRVQHTSVEDLADLLQRHALILIDLPDQPENARMLAQGLLERGYRRTVLIENLDRQPRTAQCGTASGMITIPEWFSVFDLRRVEERLVS
jgi:hypothetical protein